MITIHACAVPAMCRRMEQLDKRIVDTVSPLAALIFRERMQMVLCEAPRIGTDNSQSGVFATATVADILLEANVVIQALRLPIDLQEISN